MNKNQKSTDVKIVLVGDSGVGKTNIFTRIHRNEFSLESKPTKEVQICTDNIMIQDKPLIVQTWETTGDNRFGSIKKSYLKNAQVAIIVCDVTKKESFRSIERWQIFIKTYAGPQTLVFVIGNKSDLKNLREVQYHEALSLTESRGLSYTEVSALNSANIELVYYKVIAEAFVKLQQKTEK